MQMITKIRETWLSRKPDPRAMVINAFVTFLLALGCLFYWQDFFNAASWMPGNAHLIFEKKEIWRLWTTLFAHGDQRHLLSNCFFFFILGFFLSGYFGYWVFPLTAFFFGGVINSLVLLTMPSEVNLIGVSGVVFWMGSAWLTLYLLLDQKRTWRQRILRSFGVALMLFMPTEAFDPTTSYRAHFIGFLLGILWALGYWQLRKREFSKAIVKEVIFEDDDSSNWTPTPT